MSAPDPGLYARSFADVYDDWYHDLDAPELLVAAFVSRCGAEATIAEFGGGTGRLAGPLRQAGLTVMSVDISVPMLQQAPPGVHPVASDIADVALRTGSADAVLLAYNTLFNLTSQALQNQCVAEAARVLRPTGLLAIEAFVAPAADADGPAPDFGITIRRHPTADGGSVAIVTGGDPDDPDIIIGSHIERSAGSTVCRPWKVVYQSPGRLDAVASWYGLDLVERVADWAGTPFDPTGARHVSWYQRSRA